MPEHGGPDSSALVVDPLISDLVRSWSSGALHASRTAEPLLGCVRSLVPWELAPDYDFSFLEIAIRKADELIRDADKLAGKVEAKESAFAAVRVLVDQLRKSVEPSRKLQRLMIEMSELICGMEEVGLRLRWSSEEKDEFYNAVLWGPETKNNELLERFSNDFPDDGLGGPIKQ